MLSCVSYFLPLAATAPSDYTSVMRALTFDPNGNSILQVDIPIIEDGIEELNEDFTISLESSDPGILLSSKLALVTIINTDGMCQICKHFALLKIFLLRTISVGYVCGG